jgi:endonuclease/exonuclease/phosphatase family metal-dependent hydrolase
MRIVTWNMGCGFDTGGYRAKHGQARAWLFDHERSDVALLQETVLADLPEGEGLTCVKVPTSKGEPTGTAIVARAEGQSLPLVLDGAGVAAAELRLAGRMVVLISAHVLTGPRQERALGEFVQMAKALAGDRPCIVGGDFNASTHWPEYAAWFFEPMRLASFRDTRPGQHEVRSYWGRGSQAVIQDDHIFVRGELGGVVNWQIVDDEDHHSWSDHGPVMLDLDVGG